MESIKCVIVGDENVGKTSLFLSYYYDKFPEDYIPKVSDNIKINLLHESISIELNLWDSSTVDDYEILRKLSYPNTNIVIICFCLYEKKTLENVNLKWIPEIKKHCPNSKILIVGTKNDEKNKKFISKEDLNNLLPKEYKFISCSAKNNNNLFTVFDLAIKLVLNLKKKKKKRKCSLL